MSALPLPAPRQLPEPLTGKAVKLADVAAAGAKGNLVMFICNHCPYVVHLKREPSAAKCMWHGCSCARCLLQIGCTRL